MRAGLLRQGQGLARVGHISLKQRDLCARIPCKAGDALGRNRVGAIGERQSVSIGGQPQRNRGAYSPRGSGDKDGFFGRAVQIFCSARPKPMGTTSPDMGRSGFSRNSVSVFATDRAFGGLNRTA